MCRDVDPRAPLVLREMQLWTTRRHCLLYPIVKDPVVQQGRLSERPAEMRTVLPCADGTPNDKFFPRATWHYLAQSQARVPCDSATPLLRIYPSDTRANG